MKKPIIFILLIATACGCRFYFDTTKDNFTAVKDEGSLERGKNLAYNICGGCHFNHALNKFSGQPLNDLPKIAGHLVSANLTRSATYGRPSQYSDAELFYLLKTGISKSGKFMPYMMRPMMADKDINDIIVYLRSNDEAVSPADTLPGKTKINFIGKAGIRVAAKPQPYKKDIERPNENDPVVYGQYLVSIIGCYHCHSKKVLGLDYLNSQHSKGYLQGGIKLKSPDGKRLRGPNLTPDSTTGIGKFSLADFRKAVRDGTTPAGNELSPPMPEFKHLTDTQVNALYAHLRSLPPKKHKVKGQKP